MRRFFAAATFAVPIFALGSHLGDNPHRRKNQQERGCSPS